MNRATGRSLLVWNKLTPLALVMGLIVIAPPMRAQTRFLVGSSGGISFNNESIGVLAATETPFGANYELDFRDVFSPVESHVALGHGMANVFRTTDILWLNGLIGLTGAIEYSNYDVTHVSKGGYYTFAGPIFRFRLWDAPNRLEFSYIREVANGIHNGIETSHLQGVDVYWTARLGCSGPMCFRFSEDFAVGRVLTQGNPVCDGTYGNGSQVGFSPCPRSGAVGGSFSASVTIEFPRRLGRESDPF